MTLSLRAFAYLVTGALALLLLGALGTTPPRATPVPGDAALNHWVLITTGVEPSVVRQHSIEVVEHMREAHPGAHFELFNKFSEATENELHILLETVNTRAQRVFLDEFGEDEACRALIEREEELFETKRDTYMRLVTSDPEKEKRLGLQNGLIVWSLEARFPLVGEALETIEALVQHLNATYPEQYFRAYDEWFPRSGRLHVYVYGTGIPRWEATEARIRRDPVFRELMEGGADAFVEGSFDDLWLTILAR